MRPVYIHSVVHFVSSPQSVSNVDQHHTNTHQSPASPAYTGDTLLMLPETVLLHEAMYHTEPHTAESNFVMGLVTGVEATA